MFKLLGNFFLGQLHDSNFLQFEEMYSKFLAPFKLRLPTSLPCGSMGIKEEGQLRLFTKAFESVYANYSPEAIQQCIPPMFAVDRLIFPPAVYNRPVVLKGFGSFDMGYFNFAHSFRPTPQFVGIWPNYFALATTTHLLQKKEK